MKLVNAAQMKQIDQQATTLYHIPSSLLMEHAGMAVYEDMIKRFKKDNHFCFVCSHGNNGGDGFVVARLLHLAGYAVSIYFVGDKTKLSEDAKMNYRIVEALGIHFVEELIECDVIVDCMFGTGLTRDVEGLYHTVIEAINQSDAYVISMDIPSGIHSDNGQVMGIGVVAKLTYTMQTGKVGLYVYPGRMYAGEVVVLNIFIPFSLVQNCPSQHYLIEKDKIAKWLPKRSRHSNKGSYGKVLCVGGSEAMSGAISMAALSALKAGCGLMTCAIPKCIQNVVATNVLESMYLLLPQEDGFIHESASKQLAENVSKYTTALIGCGIGRSPAIVSLLEVLLQSEIHLLIDADGIHAFKQIKERYRMRENVILTPHLKEFADFMDTSVEQMQKNSLYYVDEFTKMFPHYTLVLKSETTIIAYQEQRFYNTYGNNGLAVGGSGDVLAGIICGLYAQNQNALQASALGVFIHAYSADLLLCNKSVYNIVPSDIIYAMEKCMQEVRVEAYD